MRAKQSLVPEVNREPFQTSVSVDRETGGEGTKGALRINKRK